MSNRNKVKSVIGYHVSRDSGTVRGKEIVAGVTYKATGRLKMCEVGCHASLTIADAATFRFLKTGRVVSLVEVTGDVRIGDKKVMGRNRKVLARTRVGDVPYEPCDVVHFGHAERCNGRKIPASFFEKLQDALKRYYRDDKRSVDACAEVVVLKA